MTVGELQLEILGFLRKAGAAVPYSQVAKGVHVAPQVALAHLDDLVAKDLVKTHFAEPSVSRDGSLERSFELGAAAKLRALAGEVRGLVEQIEG